MIRVSIGTPNLPTPIIISTTLRPSAIHAADHLPDLELGPCAAAVAHGGVTWRIVQLLVRWIMRGRLLRIVRRVPPGHRRTRILGHKNIPSTSATKTNALTHVVV